MPSDRAADAPRWQLRLLSGFELSDGVTRRQRLPSRAMVLILARLALAPLRDHPREELIDRLWPQVAQDVGRNRLRQALSALRTVLQPTGVATTPMLLADRLVVRLAPGALASDVEALREALRVGDAAAVTQLYCGEFLPGHYDEWVLEERQHLDAAAARIFGGVAQRAAATASPRAMAEARVDAPADTGSPTLAGRSQATFWLPTYLTRWVGYEAEALALTNEIRTHRLVLLRGPGGAGKTRLAVEVAHSLVRSAEHVDADFDAIAFVPLAGVTTAPGMVEATSRALRSESAGVGAGAAQDAAAQLVKLLSGRRMLLVLDNFEQLVDVARDLLAQLLARLPTLHLLVTSRHTLGLDGEHEQTLYALALPEPDATLQEHALNPAVALFVDRARAARASFHLTAGNHGQVAALVRLLHGLPLAIELAAARVRSIALADMQSMLEAATRGQPEAAFALLARGGPRAGDDSRHASMQHIMAWSFAQLSAPARAMLDGLSVCAGGATLHAGAAIAGLAPHQAAEQLDELVASSVAYARQHVHPSAAEHTRYHLFEPVREYALMTLSATAQAAWRDAHWRWVQAWADSLGHAPSLPAFRDEQANLLAAWAHAARCGQHAALLASALACAHALDDVTLPPSALALLQASLAQASHDTGLQARVHALLAEQWFECGRPEAASEHAEASLRDMPAGSRFRGDALYAAVRIRMRVHGDQRSVGALIDEGLQIAATQDRLDLQAKLTAARGVLGVWTERDYLRKIDLDTQVLALWRQHGSPARVAQGQVNLALSLGFVHRVHEQLALLHQAHLAAAANGQHRLQAFVHSVTGYALADLKRWDESVASYHACLNLAWSHSAWREWFYALWNLPRTLAHQRQPELATQLLAFADRFAGEHFGQLGWSDLRERRRTRRLVRVQIGTEREAVLWAQGRELSMADAMRMAMNPVPLRSQCADDTRSPPAGLIG